MPYIGKAPSSGIRSRFIYTATSGQTTFTGSDSNGKTLGYTDSEYVDVYLNGVLLEPSDYTATSKTSVVLDSGATVGDTMEIVVYDTFSVFNGTFSGDITVGGKVTGDLTIEDDLKLTSDSAQIAFGADSDITLTHVADSGLTLKHTATADDKPINLTLATGETDIAADDVIGKINFQAPDEGTGTDAILVAAAIQGRSEGDFSASSNATSLDFMTGASEAAATKMTIKSDGAVELASDGVIKQSGANCKIGFTDGNNVITMTTNNNERLRMNTSGTIFIGRTTGDVSTSEFGLKILQAGQLQLSRDVNGTGTVLRAFGNLGEARIVGNGNVANTNNSYSAISDETLKENISDASSQWDDIKAIKVRKFSLKADKKSSATHIGVIAQELIASNMNGLVEEMEADFDSTDMIKTVKYSVLYMKAVKALQEAMERIETLETKVAALEAE